MIFKWQVFIFICGKDQNWGPTSYQASGDIVHCCTRLSVDRILRWSKQIANGKYKDNLAGQLTSVDVKLHHVLLDRQRCIKPPAGVTKSSVRRWPCKVSDCCSNGKKKQEVTKSQKSKNCDSTKLWKLWGECKYGSLHEISGFIQQVIKYIDYQPKMKACIVQLIVLGEPQKFILCQTWDFVPTRGGGVWPNPNFFFVKLAKIKFAFVNGQKCDETHNT